MSAHLGEDVRTRAAADLYELLSADLDELRFHGVDLPRTAQQYCATLDARRRDLDRLLEKSWVSWTGIGAELGPAIASYSMNEDGMSLVAGFEVSGPIPEDLEEVTLPEASESFCGIHLGAMDSIAASWQAIHQEVVARGFTPAGPIREIYLRSEPVPQQDWVTELQQPVVPA